MTDRTCADVTIGPIFLAGKDLGIANPGGGPGGGLGGVIGELHPDFDGQAILGSGPFGGSVVSGSGEVLNGFIITRENGATDGAMQVLSFTAGGAIYLATIDVPGSDLDDLGELVISATPGGEEITWPLEAAGRGVMATGDATIAVDVLS